MTRYYHSSYLPCRFVSVSHNHLNIIRLTLFALMVFFVSSCEEGPTKIGKDLLPGSDFVDIRSIDTLSVRSYTMYDDSVRSDNPAVSYLGQIYDPYFGTTTTEFVTQIRLGGQWDDLSFIVDSVKLFLQLIDVKGGTDGVHTLMISEIAEQIYTDSVYYSNKTVPVVAPVTDILYKNDFVIDLPVLKADTINNIILDLPVEFGNYLTRDTAMLFHSNTKPDFRSFFKGLYFRLSSGTDPLLAELSIDPPGQQGNYFNIIGLYMHDAVDVDVKKEYYFILDAVNRNASFNRITHDFTTAQAGKKIEHINDSYLDTLSYLQYLNGVYTKITLPGLEGLKNDPSFDKIAVNKARLTVPVFFDEDHYTASTAPPRLRLRYKANNGLKYDVPDYGIGYDPNYRYSPFFDGSIDTANGYHFNIPNFIQGYLDDATGNLKPELEIFQGEGTRNVILKTSKSNTPVKLEFTYTKF